MKLIDHWGNYVFFFFCVSIVLLGIGHIELPFPGASFSAWSVSRTCFFFWLLWKVLIWIRDGYAHLKQATKPVPVSFPIFFAIVTVSLLPTFYQAGDYRYFFFGCMHFLVVLDLFSTEKRVKWLILLLGLTPGLLVIRGLFYDPSVLDLSRMVRFGYPLDHANTAGYLFSMSLPLAVGVITIVSGWLQILAILSVALQGIGLLLTYSRGAWVGLVLAMLFFGFAAKRYRQVISIVVLASLFALLAAPVRERFLNLMNPQNDDAISTRVRLITGSLKLGLEHPILGIGYGRGRLKEALKERFKGTIDEANPIWHAHNVYIELFADTGILGLGAFLWLLWEALLRTWQKANRAENANFRISHLAVMAALVAFAVTGLGDVPFYHHETRIYFFTLLALAHLDWLRVPAVEARNVQLVGGSNA